MAKNTQKSSSPDPQTSKKTGATKRKKKKPELFLLKKSDQYFLIPETIVNNMPPAEIFQLALAGHQAQRKQLLDDAYNGDQYINGLKIVDGLEASLTKFEKMYPGVREQVVKLDHNTNTGLC